MNVPSLHLWLIPILPFAGFLFNGILGSRIPKRLVTAVGVLAPLGSFLLVLNAAAASMISAPESCPSCGPAATAVALPHVETLAHAWINLGTLHVDFTLALDQLSLVMLLVVTGVGFLIHLYSVGYMGDEEGYARYFSYLNLFLFFMSVLVLAGNFLLMFVGWEGVGLASYLLIGFYFNKTSAAAAGKKAFIVNRIGDFGFLIGLFLLLAEFGTLTFRDIAWKLNTMASFSIFMHAGALPFNPGLGPIPSTGLLTVTALCLLLGAAGKSAQLPLYIWLPDAMEGPTPVSALIHAATMVTAGVYMIARMHTLFDHAPFALLVIAIMGAATAFFAATMGLVQTDIKRVLAYSTISQLGYMFLGCGVAAYSAAIFHLVTHAFFKALLFLGAGSVIHAMGGDQDLRNMGGLREKLPVTYWTMTIAVFTIAGFPPLAAFFSKDAILYAAYLHGPTGKLLWFVGLVTAFLTSLYMFRLWYMAFHGKPRKKLGHHHATPVSMLIPLVILAVLSFCGGWIGIGNVSSYLAPSVGAPRRMSAANAGPELLLTLAAVAVALLGWYIAYLYYSRRPEQPAQLAASMPAGYELLVNKYYVDEIYGAVIVKPLFAISKYGLGGVEFLLGGAAWLLGGMAGFAGMILQRWQSGNLRSYAAWLTAGAAAVLLFALVPWSAVWPASLHFISKVAGH